LAVGIVAALEALSFRLVLMTTKKTNGEVGFKSVFYENYYYNRCYSSIFMKTAFQFTLILFLLPAISNVCIIENQNIYAQLGMSRAEILSNRTSSGTDIINSRSNDNGTALNVITPIPSVNSTSIGRATPTTGNQSVEDSNIMGETGQPPSGIN
jgi:hypothetical protein